MNKWIKVCLILLAIFLALTVARVLIVASFFADLSGGTEPKEIATYESPDGKYTLLFEQIGDPGWPFGSAKVRFTVKNAEGKTVARESSSVANDGGPARKENIKAIRWEETQVTVTLDGWEEPEKDVFLPIKTK